MSDLSPREKELVAVGAAVAANCIPCLRAHFANAVAAGVTLEEIKAAVVLALAVKNAPSHHLMEAWQELAGTAA